MLKAIGCIHSKVFSAGDQVGAFSSKNTLTWPTPTCHKHSLIASRKNLDPQYNEPLEVLTVLISSAFCFSI
jgi:hypothetical protein